MQPILQTVHVTYNYSVHFTNHLFARENHLLRDILCRDCALHLQDIPRDSALCLSPTKILCVVDSGTYHHHPDLLDNIHTYCQYHEALLHLVCPPLIIEGGECSKNNPSNVITIHEAIHRYKICRHSYIIVVGGGALIDLVGYAAATAHRGVRLIRVPTTVLAQNDSGVGVKNGINAFGKKNFIGTFAPPVAVLNDAHFLTTLSIRDWRSGISEAIKVALLKDMEFFHFLEEKAGQLVEQDMEAMGWLIYRCAQLHLSHIATSGDPFEFGSSRPLDFGHWAAHKLEQLSNYTLRHGEAVAIGIALDSTYSHLAGLLSSQDWQRILHLFSALGLAIYTPELSMHLDDRSNTRCILTGLQEFREHLGGQLTLPLLECIGRGIEVNQVDEARIVKSITLLKEYQSTHIQEK